MDSLANLKPTAELIGELDDQIKALTKQKKDLEGDLREALAGRGAMQFGEYQFEVKTVAGRKTFDKEAAAADGFPVDNYMKQGKPYTTMSIKKVSIV